MNVNASATTNSGPSGNRSLGVSTTVLAEPLILRRAGILMLAGLFLSGCATRTVYREVPVATAPSPALTISQIKEMSAKGISDETILSALRASRSVYKLTSKDVTELQEAKVSQPVIDYLLATPQLIPTPPPAPRYRYYYYYPLWPYWHHDWHSDFHHDWHHGGHHGHH